MLLLVVGGGWVAVTGLEGEGSSDPSDELVVDDVDDEPRTDDDPFEEGDAGSGPEPGGGLSGEHSASEGDQHPESGAVTVVRPELSGTLLLYDDLGLTRVDLRDGSSDHVALSEATGGDPPFRLTRRGDAVVLYGTGGDTYAAHPAALDEQWRLGGRSSYHLPSGRSDRLWLVRGPLSFDAANRVREVTVDGEVTVDWAETPEGTVPQMAVDSGIVLATQEGLVVWDPGTGEEVVALDGVAPLATVGDRLAACASPCETLHVLDVGDGEETLVTVRGEPTHWQAATTTFSPDGERLAVIDTAPQGEGMAPDMQGALVLIGIDRRTFDTYDEGVEPPTAWTTSGRWLVASLQDGGVLLHDSRTGDGLRVDMDLPPVYAATVVSAQQPGGFSGDGAPGGPRLEEGLVVTTTRGDRSVRAVDPESGEVRWTRELDRPISLGPRAGSALLVAAQHGVTALDVVTGEQRWAVDLIPGESAGAPTVAGGVVYLPTTFGPNDVRPPRVLAIDSLSGEPLWETKLASGSDPQWAPPLVTAERVFVADTPSTQGAPTSLLHAIDRDTGEPVWEFELDVDRQGLHEGQPLAYHGLVFVTNADGTLFAVDVATGEEAWQRTFVTRPELLRAREGALTVRVDGDELQLDPATGREG